MTATNEQVVPEELVALRAAFADTATRFAGRDVAARVQALDATKIVAGEYGTLRAALVEAGLIGMAAPESVGGMGLDAGSVGIVLGRIAETCAGTAMLMWAHESALLATAMAASTAGVDAVDAGGEGLLGNALVSRHDLTAQQRSGHWQVSGTAGFVWAAGVAGQYVIAAKNHDGGVIGIVPANAPGVVVHEQHTRIGLRACPSAALRLDGVSIEHAVQLTGARYAEVITAVRQQALGLVGAIAAGNARGAWTAALQYARERYQGGAIIIEHALVQGMLGKSLADIRSAEAMATAALAGSGDDCVLAKVVATRNGEQVCLDAMQVFGGNGYMRDYGIEKRLRDAKMLCLVGSSNERLLQGVIAAHRHEGDWP